MWQAPSRIDQTLDSRAVTFENPTGARGAGGTAAGGRKGDPARRIEPGETVVLADIAGPGAVRHVWMALPSAVPEVLRAQVLEVFYDGLESPSVAVPLLDFFGLPHGRAVAYTSALTAAQEGKGLNSYVPLPFGERLRVRYTNASAAAVPLFFQIDYTLSPPGPDDGYLHVMFRRENPTTLGHDFTIADGLLGPGRFLGCVLGVRTIDPGDWYGEGEVKVYRDGDSTHPTICGTGLEDYVGSAWGLQDHAALYGGAPLMVGAEGAAMPDFAGMYRWHVPDPIVFGSRLRVTVQQIGGRRFLAGQEDELEEYRRSNPRAGGPMPDPPDGVIAHGIWERVDDYSCAAFVYCTRPQPVPRVDVEAAVADVERRPYEQGGA